MTISKEEYLAQQKREGEAEWSRIEALVRSGKHPTMRELAWAVFAYGLEPVSDAAQYVARCLVGDIKRGNKGHRDRKEPSDQWVRWNYRFYVEELKVLRKADPAGYKKKHSTDTPSMAARKLVASELKIGEDRVRKLATKGWGLGVGVKS
ncbi:MAG: hypothetical protein ACR2L2_06965 [Acidobacteriota bacterium]